MIAAPQTRQVRKAPTSFSALPRDGKIGVDRSAGEVGVSSADGQSSSSTGTRQVALKSNSYELTDHARVDPARSLRTTKRPIAFARPSRRSPSDATHWMLPSHAAKEVGVHPDHHLSVDRGRESWTTAPPFIEGGFKLSTDPGTSLKSLPRRAPGSRTSTPPERAVRQRLST